MYKKYYSDNKYYYNTVFRVQQLKFIFNVYKKHLNKQFQGVDQKEVQRIIQYYNSCYVPFDTNKENSVSCYLRDTDEPKKKIIDAILGFSVITEKSTSLQKILHDLDLSWLRSYEQMIEVQQKIMRQCQKLNIEKQQMRQKIISFYDGLLKTDVYVTETFSCFNSIAKQNLIMRLFE